MSNEIGSVKFTTRVELKEVRKEFFKRYQYQSTNSFSIDLTNYNIVRTAYKAVSDLEQDIEITSTVFNCTPRPYDKIGTGPGQWCLPLSTKVLYYYFSVDKKYNSTSNIKYGSKKIFGIAINSMEQLIENEKPDFIVAAAESKDTSRVRAYQHMYRRYHNVYSSPDNSYQLFYLDKNDIEYKNIVYYIRGFDDIIYGKFRNNIIVPEHFILKATHRKLIG